MYLRLTAIILTLGLLCGTISMAQTCTKPSQEDIIIGVLEGYIRDHPKNVLMNIGGKYEMRPLLAYETTDVFLSMYPDCCEVLDSGPEGWLPSPSETRELNFAGSVRISHNLDYLEGRDLISLSRSDTYVAIDSCGNAIAYVFDYN